MDAQAQALAVARTLAERMVLQLAGDMVDGRTLMKAAMAGYLCGSGVPTDEAVRMVEELVAHNLVSQVPANPMYRGIPWMVPGPVSGAPYYSDC